MLEWRLGQLWFGQPGRRWEESHLLRAAVCPVSAFTSGTAIRTADASGRATSVSTSVSDDAAIGATETRAGATETRAGSLAAATVQPRSSALPTDPRREIARDNARAKARGRPHAPSKERYKENMLLGVVLAAATLGLAPPPVLLLAC